MKMKMEFCGYLLIIALLIGGGVWWESFRYSECLKVGHGKFYCVMNIGK